MVSFQKSANDTGKQNKAIANLNLVSSRRRIVITELDETLQQHIHDLVNEMFMAEVEEAFTTISTLLEMILSSNDCKPQLLLLQRRLRFPEGPLGT